MNDNLKIKVLMIYYHHWGKEQTRARKVIHGIQKTNQVIRYHFLRKLPTMDMRQMSFWKYLTEAFLPYDMRHYVPYDESKEELRDIYLRVRFSHAIGSKRCILNANEDQMRRLNAIIAFPKKMHVP